MCSLKAQIAGNSWTVGEICNAEAVQFSAQSRVRE